MKILVLLFIFSLLSCNSRDLNPEKGDKIYRDIVSELSNTRNLISATQAQIDEYTMMLNNVKPQTGQIRFATKRLVDAKKRFEQLKQQEKFWIIKEHQRKLDVRTKSINMSQDDYKVFLRNEYSEYLAEKRLRQAKLHWDVNSRIDQFQKQEKVDPTGVE